MKIISFSKNICETSQYNLNGSIRETWYVGTWTCLFIHIISSIYYKNIHFFIIYIYLQMINRLGLVGSGRGRSSQVGLSRVSRYVLIRMYDFDIFIYFNILLEFCPCDILSVHYDFYSRPVFYTIQAKL